MLHGSHTHKKNQQIFKSSPALRWQRFREHVLSEEVLSVGTRTRYSVFRRHLTLRKPVTSFFQPKGLALGRCYCSNRQTEACFVLRGHCVGCQAHSASRTHSMGVGGVGGTYFSPETRAPWTVPAPACRWSRRRRRRRSCPPWPDSPGAGRSPPPGTEQGSGPGENAGGGSSLPHTYRVILRGPRRLAFMGAQLLKIRIIGS